MEIAIFKTSENILMPVYKGKKIALVHDSLIFISYHNLCQHMSLISARISKLAKAKQFKYFNNSEVFHMLSTKYQLPSFYSNVFIVIAT